MTGVLETGVILKIFGVGLAGAVGDILLRQAGKQHVAILLDAGITVAVFSYVVFKAWNVIEQIINLFGV